MCGIPFPLHMSNMAWFGDLQCLGYARWHLLIYLCACAGRWAAFICVVASVGKVPKTQQCIGCQEKREKLERDPILYLL